MDEAVKTKVAKLFDLSKNVWLNCPECARGFVISLAEHQPLGKRKIDVLKTLAHSSYR
jgi:hypothetical protein